MLGGLSRCAFALVLPLYPFDLAPYSGIAHSQVRFGCKNEMSQQIVSGGVCLGLLALLVRVVVTTPWSLPGPAAVGEEATARIGEHLFTDYLLPFELASVLLLMAMIGAIVLARRDVLANDVVTGEAADQGLIEKARTPLLLERRSS